MFDPIFEWLTEAVGKGVIAGLVQRAVSGVGQPKAPVPTPRGKGRGRARSRASAPRAPAGASPRAGA